MHTSSLYIFECVSMWCVFVCMLGPEGNLCWSSCAALSESSLWWLLLGCTGTGATDLAYHTWLWGCLGILTKVLTFAVCSSSSTHWTSLRVTPCSFNRGRRHCPQCLCLGTVLTPGRSICSLELWAPCLPSTRSYTTVGQRLVISYPRTLAS